MTERQAKPVGRDVEFVVVGKLGRTRGIEGEMYVTTFTDFPDRFLDLEEIYVREYGLWTPRKLLSSRLVGGRPVVWFVGVDSREEAAKWTNRELAVKSNDLVELPEGSYYLFDLIGCRVFDRQSGEELGVVLEVEQLPANDVYVVKRKNSEDLLVPAVKQYVLSVDVEGRRIEIDVNGLRDDLPLKNEE